jgi:anti-sigma-K factor RskA
VEHVDELIAGQALHALSTDDEELVVLHVAECDRCRRQLREAEAVAASLAYLVPASTPPPDLRSRVLAPVEPVVEAPPVAAPVAEPRRRTARAAWWPRFAAVAVPVMAAAVVGLVAWNVSLRNQVSSLEGPLQRGQVAPLPGVGSVLTKAGGKVTLFASIRHAPAGKTYEAWVIHGQAAVPAGLFQGGGTIKLTLTKPAKPGDVIAITIEPAGGTTAPTTKPIAAHKV